MALTSWIAELLRRERIPYTYFRHVPAYTAQEEAAVSHIPQRISRLLNATITMDAKLG